MAEEVLVWEMDVALKKTKNFLIAFTQQSAIKKNVALTNSRHSGR